jgi:glycine/D-amino acid oxidase-like deaminating enzyme
MPTPILKQAIVIGAGMGGLAAARAVAPHCERVIVFDRDALPDAPAPRPGTPQSWHSHGLLTGGHRALANFYFTAEKVKNWTFRNSVRRPQRPAIFLSRRRFPRTNTSRIRSRRRHGPARIGVCANGGRLASGTQANKGKGKGKQFEKLWMFRYHIRDKRFSFRVRFPYILFIHLSLAAPEYLNQ